MFWQACELKQITKSWHWRSTLLHHWRWRTGCWTDSVQHVHWICFLGIDSLCFQCMNACIHTYMYYIYTTHVHIHTCIHTYTHTFIHSFVHSFLTTPHASNTQIQTCIRRYINTYTVGRIPANTYLKYITWEYVAFTFNACIHILYAQIYTYTHTWMHAYIHAHIHSFIHTYSKYTHIHTYKT